MQHSNGKKCHRAKENVADKQIQYGSEEKSRSVALYGAETWTLSEAVRKKFEDFES